MERKYWQDDVDLWLSMTAITLSMYLLATPNPYTSEALMNYQKAWIVIEIFLQVGSGKYESERQQIAILELN